MRAGEGIYYLSKHAPSDVTEKNNAKEGAGAA